MPLDAARHPIGTPLWEDVHRQYALGLRRAENSGLDPKSALWIIRRDAWRWLRAAADSLDSFTHNPETGYRRLLGLPVRLTIGDEPDMPMVLLVMEVKMKQQDFVS